MKKILVTGAGGAASEGVIYSLLKNPQNIIIGAGSEPSDLILSLAPKKYLLPFADKPAYKTKLLTLLDKEKPDFIHFQNDLEVFHASLFRDEILKAGVNFFLPHHSVIDTCVHKFKSYKAFKRAGIKVPRNIIINNLQDLELSFNNLSNKKGYIWLRSNEIGGGGKGSLPTNDLNLAVSWINHFSGWGKFIAAEMLTPRTVTFLSIWKNGELIIAQTRSRQAWTHSNRSISGVTGVTKVGTIISNDIINEIAINSIRSIDKNPHGIFGVDMTYDSDNVPNPTEINIARFFTTIRFFTEAGVNFPEIYLRLAFNENSGIKKGTINPLDNGLMWLRSMDKEPLLCDENLIKDKIIII